jgi:hypothetical protein
MDDAVTLHWRYRALVAQSTALRWQSVNLTTHSLHLRGQALQLWWQSRELLHWSRCLTWARGSTRAPRAASGGPGGHQDPTEEDCSVDLGGSSRQEDEFRPTGERIRHGKHSLPGKNRRVFVIARRA